MYGPSFESIGADGAAKIKDMNYAATETGDAMLLIDPVTAEYTELVYIAQADINDTVGEGGVPGWYFDNGDDTFTYKGEDTVSLGCAFWLFAGNGSVNLTDAGEVKGDFSRTLPGGLYSAFANPFPCNVPLKTFVYGATETGDAMLLIDLETAAYTELVYIAEADLEDTVGEGGVAGWYYDNGDDTFTYKGNDVLVPGQGCWIFPGNGTVTITASL